jgi:hypothetical protein
MLRALCHPEPRRQRQAGSDRGTSHTLIDHKKAIWVSPRSWCEALRFAQDDTPLLARRYGTSEYCFSFVRMR